MIHLSPNEKILMILHRHWIVIVTKILLGLLLLLLPLILFPLISSFIDGAALAAYFGFFTVIYFMIISAFLFVFWIDYYLDVWIITSERIVDIEQRGLFNREISEFMLDKVQDITIEIPNMAAALLKYGNIIIQTAGERSFSIKQIPKVYEAKNLILDYAAKKKCPDTISGRRLNIKRLLRTQSAGNYFPKFRA